MSGLGYTKSLVIIFIIPFLFLLKPMLKSVRLKPFLCAIAVVSIVGWAWSAFLASKAWWIFPRKDIVGVTVLPHLCLEEFVIYPIGGALSIYLYMLASRKRFAMPNPSLFWVLLLIPTASFLAVALSSSPPPYYLYSQLLVYNALSLALAFSTAKSIRLHAVLMSVAVLGVIGFAWDFMAFSFDWWIYTAITGIRLIRVPIEDINFYLMAPTAAISLYVYFCRLIPPPEPERHP